MRDWISKIKIIEGPTRSSNHFLFFKATSYADNKIVVATKLCEWGFVKEINLSKNDQFYYMS